MTEPASAVAPVAVHHHHQPSSMHLPAPSAKNFVYAQLAIGYIVSIYAWVKFKEFMNKYHHKESHQYGILAWNSHVKTVNSNKRVDLE